MSKMPPKLPAKDFTYDNAANTNRVFLYKNVDVPPFVVPVKGWQIVGIGTAPWPGSTNNFAVMFEKIVPPTEPYSIWNEEHESLDEGTRIWQHYYEHWLKDHT